MKKPVLRGLLACLTMLLIGWFLLATVQGPIWSDGVAFYLPIILFAFVAWALFVCHKQRSKSYTFLTGVVGGLVGTMVWPTGLLVAMILTNTADPRISPIVMLFAICFAASVLGGVVAMLLSFGFDRESVPVHGDVELGDAEARLEPVSAGTSC